MKEVKLREFCGCASKYVKESGEYLVVGRDKTFEVSIKKRVRRVSRREWMLQSRKFLVEGEFIITNRGVDEYRVLIEKAGGFHEESK